MKREEEMKSPNGQAALNYYQLWMRNMKRMPPPAAAFMTSKYFRTFVNFTLFSKKVDLPMPEKFIWFMVEKDYPPTLWTNDEVYSMYLEFLDHKTTPIEQAKLSLDTLYNYASNNRIEVDYVFDHLHPMDIIHMLRVRKLSPWLLLNSKKFRVLYATGVTDEQRIIMDALIGQPERWMTRFKEHSTEVETIKLWAKEFGI
jgi:hypothetical protein